MSFSDAEGRAASLGKPVRVGIVEVPPIHYRAPLYRLLARDPRLDLTVIYASSAGVRPFDSGFGQNIIWDVDLLSGYRSIFLNKADRNDVYGSMFSVWDWDVIRRVWAGKFDVLWVMGYYFITLQLAMLTQLVARRALLFREEQTLLEPRPFWKRALKQTILRLELSRSCGLYAGSENRRWMRAHGIPDEKLFHVPYAVDAESLSAEAARLRPLRFELRRKWGLPDEDVPVILTVGRLVEKKQPGFLVEAFRRARLEHRCALMIAGSGPLQSALEAQIARDDIKDVVLAGFVNQSRIAEAFVVADIFVLASAHDETWGLVVNEAMPFNLPLILSDKVGSGTDLVKPGENGYIVSATDPKELADRIVELVESRETRARMGQASARVARDWSFAAAAEGALKAIAAAVGERRWSQAETTAHPSQRR